MIGAAGYIAPRHMNAINSINGDLVAAVDKSDSVGILDSYFPNAAFFTEFERFDRHLEKIKSKGNSIDFLSVCSPNYLHDAHVRHGLRYGSNVICEKPIVLNPWNLDGLGQIEKDTGQKVHNILQLRLHKSIIDLKSKIDNSPKDKIFDVDLTYITSRGSWYYASWKGDESKSGGIATNIGIHFFDMLWWIFGALKTSKVHVHTHDRAAGYFEFEKARVRWFLSINFDTLPNKLKEEGKRTYRSITVDSEEIEFSQGFESLHNDSYRRILDGRGFSIKDARPSIEIAHLVRTAKPIGLKGDYHQFAKKELSPHPFKKDNLGHSS